MNLFQSINYCLKHYSDFNGRASRSEYWWFYLFTLIVETMGTILVYGFLSYFDTAQEFGIFETIAVIVFLLPILAVGARRLHDINRSGWWQLLILTLIGIILLIIWWASVGENKKNNHGNPINLKR